MVDGIYAFVKSVIESMPNFSINDVMETDIDLLTAIMSKQEKPSEVVGLSDFIENI